MSTLFISDLHLCSSRPSVTQRFFEFLESPTAKNCEALFILGDFFEVWVGDDNTDPHYRTIIQALARFTQQGPPVYFMQGNRDFLIGKRFAKETGMRLIPDPHLIELYGKRIVLMHGDSLCTSDVAHQRFRKIVHNPIIQWIFLRLPLTLRQKIAKKLRAKSQHRNQKYASTMEDLRFTISTEAVTQVLLQHQAQTLIHGHTHQPGIHEFILNDQPAKRIVLGEWGALGNILVYEKDSLALKSI